MHLLIQTIRKYIPFSSADEAVAQQLFHQQVYKKGDHLLAEGEICRSVFFVKSGLVRYYISKDGEDQTNYFNTDTPEMRYQNFLLSYPDSSWHHLYWSTIHYRPRRGSNRIRRPFCQ